jgi:hypothetical protein
VFSQLVIKAVVDSSLHLGRQVDIENLPLRQFFVILDLVFRHGFKSGKVITLFSIEGSGNMFVLAIGTVQSWVPVLVLQVKYGTT